MSMQDVFNDAAAESLGFLSVQRMLDSIPVEKRLPDTAPRQDQINHAFAVLKGFKNVEDLVEAQGMRGAGFDA